jgi:hypothetical protein
MAYRSFIQEEDPWWEGNQYFPLKTEIAGRRFTLMKRTTLFLTALVLATLLLAACGGEQTSTSVPGTNVPPATMEATSTQMTASTQAAGTADLTTTANVPVTGDDSPNRLTE